jgi:hypothetical protein
MNWGVQKMQTSLKYMLVALVTMLFMAAGTSAWSDCACFCVDGELATMCTEVGEAQDSPNLCPNNGSASCPQEPGAGSSAAFEAPSEGAVDCRNIRVYDAIRGQYVTAKACNVI